jgi:putative ABC transport system substrate-binding protein
MRRTKKSLKVAATVTSILVLVLTWASCSAPAPTNSARIDIQPSPAQKKSVAMVIPVTIDAFDRLQEGSKNVLTPLNIELRTYSAEGDPAKFETVVKSALLSRPDYLVTVGTQLTNTAFGPQFKGQLPTVIAAAISDPKLVEGLTKVGVDPPRSTPVAIISDSPKEDIFSLTAKTIKSLNANTARMGILYNLSEVNSKATAEGVIKAIEANGMTAVRGVLTNPDDVSKVTADLLRKGAQVIVIPHDKYAVEKAATIAQLAHAKNVPTLSLDDGTVRKSGVMAAVSVDYRIIGELVGNTISDIAQAKTRAQDLPVVSLDRASVYLNEEVAKSLGVTVPQEVSSNAVLVTAGK